MAAVPRSCSSGSPSGEETCSSADRFAEKNTQLLVCWWQPLTWAGVFTCLKRGFGSQPVPAPGGMALNSARPCSEPPMKSLRGLSSHLPGSRGQSHSWTSAMAVSWNISVHAWEQHSLRHKNMFSCEYFSPQKNICPEEIEKPRAHTKRNFV